MAVSAKRSKPFTCYPSAARTASPTAMTRLKNSTGGRGLVVIIDTTAAGSSPSTVFTIQGYDPITEKYYTILASAAITATGTVILRVFPGATAAANLVANDVLPAEWRVIATHGNGTSHTYIVSAVVLEM